jgi:hypothetical protein
VLALSSCGCVCSFKAADTSIVAQRARNWSLTPTIVPAGTISRGRRRNVAVGDHQGSRFASPTSSLESTRMSATLILVSQHGEHRLGKRFARPRIPQSPVGTTLILSTSSVDARISLSLCITRRRDRSGDWSELVGAKACQSLGFTFSLAIRRRSAE